MSESNRDVRRVVVEVLPKDLQELVALLGDFAMKHDISVDISSFAQDTAEPSTSAEEQKYNPQMVEWVDDTESQQRVAIVTKKLLVEFAESHDYSPSGSIKIYNTLFRESDNRDFYFLFQETGYGHRVSKGIKADKMENLVSSLVKNDQCYYGIGTTSILFLRNYTEEMLRIDKAVKD